MGLIRRYGETNGSSEGWSRADLNEEHLKRRGFCLERHAPMRDTLES